MLGVTACSLKGSIGPQVKFSMYMRYVRALGLCFTFWTFMGYTAQYVAYTGTNLWLSEWTDDSQRYLNETYPTQLRDLRIGVFGALGMAQGEQFPLTSPVWSRRDMLCKACSQQCSREQGMQQSVHLPAAAFLPARG